ncbi:hypothetical protein GJ496_002355 [Pomphorhynchus laevis]|nr:hypothetical protein GJ496_002355 [Pomphorhynchus laevis]
MSNHSTAYNVSGHTFASVVRKEVARTVTTSRINMSSSTPIEIIRTCDQLSMRASNVIIKELVDSSNDEQDVKDILNEAAACGHRNCLNKVRQGTQRPLWMRAIQRAMIFLSKRFRFDISVCREYVLLRQFYTHLNVMWRKTKLHAEEQKRIYLAEKAPWILLRRNNSGTSQIPLSAWVSHFSRIPLEILDSNPSSGIDSHGRPKNDINDNVGPLIYCTGNNSPVQSKRRSPSHELEQTASPELESRRSSRCRKNPPYLHEYEMG